MQVLIKGLLISLDLIVSLETIKASAKSNDLAANKNVCIVLFSLDRAGCTADFAIAVSGLLRVKNDVSGCLKLVTFPSI